MKLREFTSKRIERFTEPAISLHFSNGEVRFSSQLVDKLNIQINSRVQFFQDEHSPQDWYLKVNCTRGFKIRQKPDGRLLFSNKSLVYAIFESLKLKKGDRPIVPVSTERDLTNDTYALITHTIL